MQASFEVRDEIRQIVDVAKLRLQVAELAIDPSAASVWKRGGK